VALGCVGHERASVFAHKAAALDHARRLVGDLWMSPNKLNKHGFSINLDGVSRSVSDLLAHPGIDLARLAAVWPELAGLRPDVAEQIEVDALYASYLVRQEADVLAFRRDEALVLSEDLDYGEIGGLSNEVCEKLTAVRPTTLGAAGRISGVTPAALTALLGHVQRGHGKRTAQAAKHRSPRPIA
jgi:tRNA uridine 5-carboxymethylaminomethyl modification enzyme